jgi:hypothetical protein
MVEGEEDEHEHGEHGAPKVKKLKRAVICGVDSISLSVAAKLLKAGWRVTLMDTLKSNLILAKSLGIAKKDTRSNIDGGAANLGGGGGGGARAPPVEVDQVGVDVTDSSSSTAAADETSLLSPSTGGITVSDGHLITPINVVTAEKEPLLDLILVPSGAQLGSQSSSSTPPHGVADAPPPSISFGSLLPEDVHPEVAIIGLESDQASYELGALFSRGRHAGKVLVRIVNPAWTSTFTTAGLLPVSSFGATSSTLYASATSRGNLQLVSATLGLSDALASLIDPVEDLQHQMLPMSGHQRAEWEEQHPNPTAAAMAQVAQHLRDSGVDSESVRLLQTVSHGQREEYIDKLHRLHSLESGVEMSEEDKARHDEMFSGQSLHAHADAEKALARRAEAQEAEAEATRQVEMALARK